MKTKVHHTLEAVYNQDSRILILGTMPSPKSRELGFYYGHPQNRFWRVLAKVFRQEVPQTIEEKKEFLLSNEIAVWDVLASCDIKNADDSSISEPVANDFSTIFNIARIEAVFTTGKKATSLYKKLCHADYHSIPAIGLPSTSPANCATSLDKLVEEYKLILDVLNK